MVTVFNKPCPSGDTCFFLHLGVVCFETLYNIADRSTDTIFNGVIFSLNTPQQEILAFLACAVINKSKRRIQVLAVIGNGDGVPAKRASAPQCSLIRIHIIRNHFISKVFRILTDHLVQAGVCRPHIPVSTCISKHISCCQFLVSQIRRKCYPLFIQIAFCIKIIQGMNRFQIFRITDTEMKFSVLIFVIGFHSVHTCKGSIQVVCFFRLTEHQCYRIFSFQGRIFFFKLFENLFHLGNGKWFITVCSFLT